MSTNSGTESYFSLASVTALQICRLHIKEADFCSQFFQFLKDAFVSGLHTGSLETLRNLWEELMRPSQTGAMSVHPGDNP